VRGGRERRVGARRGGALLGQLMALLPAHHPRQLQRRRCLELLSKKWALPLLDRRRLVSSRPGGMQKGSGLLHTHDSMPWQGRARMGRLYCGTKGFSATFSLGSKGESLPSLPHLMAGTKIV
jgi:hypothetical protein